MELSQEEYCDIKDLLLEKTGISLKDSRQALVEARLSKYLRGLQVSTYKEYLKLVKKDKKLMGIFINALTTNKTEFFRENDHFKYLEKVILPQNRKNCIGDEYFNVWSAASSTGEEVYTLAMVLSEYFQEDPYQFRILGTDLDTDVLEKAQRAIYKNNSIGSLDDGLVSKYFSMGLGQNNGLFKFNHLSKNNIKFRQFNLVKDDFGLNIKFDVIFLRNVLIYFDDSTIQVVLNKLTNQLKDGGYLFIGHSESLNRVSHNLKNVSPSVFQKV